MEIERVSCVVREIGCDRLGVRHCGESVYTRGIDAELCAVAVGAVQSVIRCGAATSVRSSGFNPRQIGLKTEFQYSRARGGRS